MGGGGGWGERERREREMSQLCGYLMGTVFIISCDLSLELDKLWRSMYILRKPRVLSFITQELEEKVGSK